MPEVVRSDQTWL